MKGLAIAWVMFVAVVVSVLGVWFIANSAPLFPSLITLGSSGTLFAVGVMLTRDGQRW